MERPGIGDPLGGWQGASGWLVRRVLGDPGAVAEAQRLIRDGGLDRYLCARRLIEDGAEHDALDFRWSAKALRAGGYEPEARLLESLTVTENWLRAAAVRWENRYVGRLAPDTTAAMQQLRLGLVSLVGLPRRGIDGSMYQEGRYNGRSALEGTLAVIVAGRGAAEIIRGWDSREEARAWMHGRLPSVTGPLPPPPASRRSRAWAEEQALAYLLTHLSEAGSLAGPLACYVFSADVRDETYRAILATAIRRSSGPAGREHVAAETEARYAWAPAWAREELGGSAAPWVRSYVERLATTDVSRGAARDAIRRLSLPHPAPGYSRSPLKTRTSHPTSPHPPVIPLQRRPPEQPSPGPTPRMI